MGCCDAIKLMRPPDVVLTASAVGLAVERGKWRWLPLPSCITATCSDVLVAVLSAVDTLAGVLVMLRPEGTAMTLSLDTDAVSLEAAVTSTGIFFCNELPSAAVSSLASFSLCCTGMTVKPVFRWSFCRMLCGLALAAEA